MFKGVFGLQTSIWGPGQKLAVGWEFRRTTKKALRQTRFALTSGSCRTRSMM